MTIQTTWRYLAGGRLAVPHDRPASIGLRLRGSPPQAGAASTMSAATASVAARRIRVMPRDDRRARPVPSGSGHFGLLEQERQGGTGVGGSPCVSEQMVGDRPWVDDRISPLIERYPLGK